VFVLGLAIVSTKAIPETEANPELAITKPYRTFVTIKKYTFYICTQVNPKLIRNLHVYLYLQED
jgi:hypothetical protein